MRGQFVSITSPGFLFPLPFPLPFFLPPFFFAGIYLFSRVFLPTCFRDEAKKKKKKNVNEICFSYRRFFFDFLKTKFFFESSYDSFPLNRNLVRCALFIHWESSRISHYHEWACLFIYFLFWIFLEFFLSID